jgi:hypothetical protein
MMNLQEAVKASKETGIYFSREVWDEELAVAYIDEEDYLMYASFNTNGFPTHIVITAEDIFADDYHAVEDHERWNVNPAPDGTICRCGIVIEENGMPLCPECFMSDEREREGA